MPVSLSPALSQTAIKPVSSGTWTTALGAGTYDVGNFSTSAALGSKDILVFCCALYSAAGGAGKLYLDNAAGALSGNEVEVQNAANVSSMIAHCEMWLEPQNNAQTLHCSWVMQGGGASDVNSAISTAIVLNAAETLYIKFVKSNAAQPLTLNWQSYIIEAA